MALSNKNITIHIGMPKSASTTLQRYFINGLQNIEYIGPEAYSEGYRLFLEIMNKDDLSFNFNLIQQGFLDHLNHQNPVIFSSEFACGLRSVFLSGQVQSRTTVCDRFAKLTPQAKILIILRNQFDLHKSLHAQLLRNESTFLDINKFTLDAWMEKNINLHKQHWASVFDFADYYPLVKMYQRKFKHVKIVFFEEIIKNMESFVNDNLISFLDLKDSNIKSQFINKIENTRHNTTSIKTNDLIKRTSHILKTRYGNPLGNVDRGQKEKIINNIVELSGKIIPGKKYKSYSKKHENFLREFYTESNQKISVLLDVDLKKFGYPV